MVFGELELEQYGIGTVAAAATFSAVSSSSPVPARSCAAAPRFFPQAFQHLDLSPAHLPQFLTPHITPYPLQYYYDYSTMQAVKQATASKKELVIGMIAGDGIGKVVLPVSRGSEERGGASQTQVDIRRHHLSTQAKTSSC